MSNLKKNLSYNFILSLSQLIFPIISIPYISRILDPEGIGKVSFIDSFTWYFVALADFGIPTYAIREVAKRKNDKANLSKFISEMFSLHIITSGITLIVYFICVMVLWQKIADIRLLLFSLSFLLVSFFSCEWYYIGIEKFRYIAIRSMIVRLLGLLSIFLLVRSRSDHYLYYGIIAGSAIITLIWNLCVLLKEVPLSFRSLNIKQHVRHIFVLFQITVFFSASIWLDNVLLGILGSAAALAYYAFAAKLVRIAGALITDTLQVLYPRMVALLHEKDHEKFRSVNLLSIQMIITLAVPLAAGLFLLADPFTALYLGPKFRRVGVNVQILSVYPLLKSYSLTLNKQLLLPHHHDRVVVRGLAAGFAALVTGMILLCPFFQDIGASISIIFAECITLIYFIAWIRIKDRQVQLFDTRSFLQAIACSLLFVPVTYFVYRLPLPLLYQIMIIVIVCITIYCIFQSLFFKNKILLQIYSSVRQLI